MRATPQTQDQHSALDFLDSFVDMSIGHGMSAVRHAVVEGFAGVGKTWVAATWLEHLLERMPRLRVCVMAPTNKALDVLRDKCRNVKASFVTIDSYLKYKVKRNDDLVMERTQHGKPLEYDLLVCDEGSMVKADYHKELIRQRVPIVYFGDPAQLNPVGEGASPAFNTEDKVRMTEIVRAAKDSPIIQMSHWLRSRVEDGQQFILQDARAAMADLGFAGDNRISYTTSDKVLDWAETALDKGLTNRIMSFDNASVAANNAQMHQRRYPGAKLFGVGETALVNETFEVKVHKNQELLLCNGQTFEVLACDDAEPIAGVDVCDVTLATKTFTVTSGDKAAEYVEYITCKVAVNEQQYLSTHRELTTGIWDARKSGNHGEAERLVQLRRPLNQLAPLRHNYASTVHKAQGSTYDIAFVDWPSIYRSRDMRARLMYVAATRAAKYLVIAA